MHIKFLKHGNGSAPKAAAYLLDKLDHHGIVRAGVDVLRGDANTFNAICNASPHQWKYTSGVIAWSKKDAPTQEQIQEVLTEFENHAFVGLDRSQYHFFAVQHTDDDGSKHIHVLVPRLDLVSGKHLNIAPPKHETYFDSLRDYFNTKYQWSSPDDPLLMKFTQDPNHIAKLNKQAKRILPQQKFESLTKKQFAHAINNYLLTLVSNQTLKNRADIVAHLKELNDIDSVKEGKDYLSVTLHSGTTHRLKGTFYHAEFESNAYAEHIRRAAEIRRTPDELTAALRAAEQLQSAYRAKRAAYHRKRYPFTPPEADSRDYRCESQLDFERDRQLISTSLESSNNGLSRSVKSNRRTDSEYRYIETQNAFSFNPIVADRNRQKNQQHFNRPEEHTSSDTNPSTASNSEPKRLHGDRNSVTIKVSKSKIHDIGKYGPWTADPFNQFLYRLSVQYTPKDNRRTKRNDPTELTNNTKSNQLLEQHTEISDADRNRPVLSGAKHLIESTKQLIGGTKRLIDATSRLIKERLGLLRQAESRLEQQNQQLGNRERNDEGINCSDEIGAFKTRTRQIFRRISAKIIKQLEQSISAAMDESLSESGFNRHAEEYRARRNEERKDKAQERSLENIADDCAEGLQRRVKSDERQIGGLREGVEELEGFSLELDQLATDIKNIRLKPKPATHFSRLRYDGYYPDYAIAHREFSGQQEYAYQNNRTFDVIHIIEKKSKKLMDYMSRARKMLHTSDYQQIKEIVQNDERMLRYLKCNELLEPQNSRFMEQKARYLSCLDNFKEIKSIIHAVTSPQPESLQSEVVERSNEPELKLTLEQENDFNLDS